MKSPLREQCEAYLLGLLDAGERGAIDALVANNDPECAAAMREASDFLAALATAVPAADPSPLIRSRLLNSIRGAAEPKPARAAIILPWAVAAALAAAAFTQYSSARDKARDLAEAQGRVASLMLENEQQKQVLGIVLARDARLIPLATSAREPLFRAFWRGNAASGGLVLAGANVPAPAAGRTLQLWVVPKSGNPVSAGVFAPDPQGNVLFIAAGGLPRQDTAAALAVSDEPTGGSPQPTTTPAYVGPVGD